MGLNLSRRVRFRRRSRPRLLRSFSSPRKDVIEAITHNSGGENAGQMVDYYNHWLWTPLCEAVTSLSYRADADERHPLASARATTPVASIPDNDASNPDDFKQAAGAEFAKTFATLGQVSGTTVEAPGIEDAQRRADDTIEHQKGSIGVRAVSANASDRASKCAIERGDVTESSEGYELSNVVETALARALLLAAEAGRWDVVGRIAAELEGRRTGRGGRLGLTKASR